MASIARACAKSLAQGGKGLTLCSPVLMLGEFGEQLGSPCVHQPYLPTAFVLSLDDGGLVFAVAVLDVKVAVYPVERAPSRGASVFGYVQGGLRLRRVHLPTSRQLARAPGQVSSLGQALRDDQVRLLQEMDFSVTRFAWRGTKQFSIFPVVLFRLSKSPKMSWFMSSSLAFNNESRFSSGLPFMPFAAARTISTSSSLQGGKPANAFLAKNLLAMRSYVALHL